MYKFLFKKLLFANYSFARRWVNKKLPENVIPVTVYTFLTTFSFLISAVFCVILGSIEYKVKYPEVTFMIIILIIGYGFQKITKKAFFRWNIEKEYQMLSKEERRRKNTFAFFFFWGSFALFLYLGAKFIGGYSVK